MSEFEDRIAKIGEAMRNPCPDGEHQYEPMVAPIGKATMINEICTKCFDIQGWLYDWQENDDE